MQKTHIHVCIVHHTFNTNKQTDQKNNFEGDLSVFLFKR